MVKLFVARVRVAVAKVVGDRSREEPRLLRDIGDPFAKVALAYIAYVLPVKGYFAVGDIVVPEQQLRDRRFAAPRSADQGGGLPLAACKVYLREGVLVGIGKAEGYIFKCRDLVPAGHCGLLLAVVYRGGVFKHLGNSLYAGERAGKEQDGHLRHHYVEEYPYRVFGHRGDVSDLHGAGTDAVSAEVEYRNDADIYRDRREAVKPRKEPVGAHG